MGERFDSLRGLAPRLHIALTPHFATVAASVAVAQVGSILSAHRVQGFVDGGLALGLGYLVARASWAFAVLSRVGLGFYFAGCRSGLVYVD